MDDLESRLRGADELSVAVAMDHAAISWPINDRAELLEAFNRILDVLGVPDADGDVYTSEDLAEP
ncbi:hypothetical protein KRR38_34225 [Novosphingobium sp. G106]|uniref:hypothetical protein n=1 Tax=Novosphingobium sp. G106 TaxID=2849500 RepID=UPI001C2D82D4|nr:hypothetical protein [Novosphingobium sp. G106]MBV1692557.1 hypothetical protein [Novosphingobium sp. G106]